MKNDAIAIAAAFMLSAFALDPVRAVGQNVSIYQATLAEANQKTAEVSTEEVRRILSASSALILDSRTRAEFVAGHIPGAQNVDASSPEAIGNVNRLVDADKTKALVLYCNGPFCQASRRLADQLVGAGFSNVRRYQVGLPIWRALGGPTQIELEGILRILNVDRTAVFFDGRSAEEFGRGSVPGAQNVPVDLVTRIGLQKAAGEKLPHDDFNTRVVLFGRDASQARTLADAFSKSPWHNVTYYAGSFESLSTKSK